MPDALSAQIVSKPDRPVLVTIISWTIFLQGILSLISIPLIIFAAMFFSSLSDRGADFSSASFILLMVMLVAVGLLEIFLSFGLRAMKRWTLYTFTILTILQVISAVFINSKFYATGLINAVLGVGITLYLLSISKKFT